MMGREMVGEREKEGEIDEEREREVKLILT